MTNIRIEEVRGDEIEPILEMAFYAFFSSPGNVEQVLKNKHYFKEDQCLVLYENEKIVAGLMCKPIPQNVRGKIKKMCGVGEVVTNPEARRKGYAKKLMNLSFEKMKEQEQVFSTLYPFKEAFYEKLGYISWPQYRTAIFSPSSLLPLLNENLPGSVERISINEGFEIYLDFIKNYQKKTHGMGIKHDTEQQRLKEESNYWLAIARDENQEVIGIMTYRITGFWKELKVRYFYYNNSLAKYLLLQWFAHHSDQVREVHIPILPDDYPEIWFNDTFWGEKGKIISRDWVPSAMGRVILVEQLGDLHVGEGEISFKVIDKQCPWNNDIFKFESNNGLLKVSRTTEFDCEITIQGLSAIIYGCYNLDDFPFKKWGSLTESSKEKIRKLFPPIIPYLHADF